jgi:glutamine synthetase
VRFLRLQFTDVLGMPRTVAIPADQAEKPLTTGIGFDGSSKESDMLPKPDLSAYALLVAAARGCSRPVRLQRDRTRWPALRRRPVLRAAAGRWTTCQRTATPSTPGRNWVVDGKPTIQFQGAGGYFDLAPPAVRTSCRG